MKVLAYVGWTFLWFLIHSFLFTPAINASEAPMVSGPLAAVNVALLISGYILIAKRM